jgi:hypothetical protein
MYPPSAMTIEVKEQMTQNALMDNVWRRIQQPILSHFEHLSTKSTSCLPQSITISGPYHLKVRGIPTVTIDLSNDVSRRQTELIVHDKEREFVSAQTFQDGHLVRSKGLQ